MVQKNTIIKIENFGKSHLEKDDVLAIEEPLEIALEHLGTHIPVSVTMRTPGNDQDLAVGFLFTEGIIFSKKNLDSKITAQLTDNQIKVFLNPEFSPNIDKLKRNFYTTSSCGVCGKESIEAIKQVCSIPITQDALKVTIEKILELPEKLRTEQKTFASTGGIHAAALFSLDGTILNLKEDVGRHNALDKLIGAELLKQNAEFSPLDQHILLLSGRASFELIQKAAMAGIKIIAAIGAPSSLAVATAASFGITLIGFVKNQSANIYTGKQRIIY